LIDAQEVDLQQMTPGKVAADRRILLPSIATPLPGGTVESRKAGLARRPVWSGALTDALAARIPDRSRPAALTMIKGLHTAIFASVAACIALFVWDGIRQRAGHRATIALGIALAETAVYASNNQVCPLTPLAEELGAEHGSVADIYLPDWLSRRIPLLGGTALLLGIALRLRALGPSQRNVGGRR
jgi:hypothetical protein